MTDQVRRRLLEVVYQVPLQRTVGVYVGVFEPGGHWDRVLSPSPHELFLRRLEEKVHYPAE